MIIGLTGLSGSGKDTVANHLVENYGFNRRAFADPLRKFLYEFNPQVKTRESTVRPLKEIVEVEGGWHRAQLVHPEVRNLLQRFATEFVREKVDPMFWVKLSMFDINSSDSIVFSDVRFPNEADAINKKGGIVIKVVSKTSELYKMDHISENQRVPYLYTIENDGSLDDLYYKVDKILGKVLKFKEISYE